MHIDQYLQKMKAQDIIEQFHSRKRKDIIRKACFEIRREMANKLKSNEINNCRESRFSNDHYFRDVKNRSVNKLSSNNPEKTDILNPHKSENRIPPSLLSSV